MNNKISNNSWVYVIIQNPGAFEQLVGFEDDNKYIPVNKTKEEAEVFLTYIPREPGKKYEIQAIIYEDVINYAANNHFMVYIVNNEGKIIEKIDPKK